MQIQELARRVRATCGDKAKKVLTDETLNDIINDGVRELYRRASLEVITTTNAATGSIDSLVLPTNFLEILHASFRGKDIRQGSKSLIRNIDPHYKVEGVPSKGWTRYYWTEASNIMFWPATPDDTLIGDLVFTSSVAPSLLDLIGAPATEIPIRAALLEPLHNFCNAKGKEISEDFDQSTYFWTRYEAMMMDIVSDDEGPASVILVAEDRISYEY